MKYINTDIWAEERLEYNLSTPWFAYISLFRIGIWAKDEGIVAVGAYGHAARRSIPDGKVRLLQFILF